MGREGPAHLTSATCLNASIISTIFSSRLPCKNTVLATYNSVPYKIQLTQIPINYNVTNKLKADN